MSLTIGMACYDDYDGVYFTVQSLRLHHACDEILVVDNNPESPQGLQTARFCADVGVRYESYTDKVGAANTKNRVVEMATSDWVLVIDCHVLLVPWAVERLRGFTAARPDFIGLIHGPLLTDDFKTVFTHWEPVWDGGMWGKWAEPLESLGAFTFPIQMFGCGLFATRKDTWLGFNPNFRGFGGEEGYIHEKYRQAGREILCVPLLQWVHRFDRPKGVPFPNLWEDRIHNYYTGFEELGMDVSEMEVHFINLLGMESFKAICKSLGRVADEA